MSKCVTLELHFPYSHLRLARERPQGLLGVVVLGLERAIPLIFVAGPQVSKRPRAPGRKPGSGGSGTGGR